MIKMNSKFLPFFAALLQEPAEPLAPRLLAVYNDGFVTDGRAYVLKYFSQTNIQRHNFQDLTGYEFTLNKLHIGDYAEKNLHQQTFRFIRNVFRLWSHQFSGELLNAIVSINLNDIVVGFHTKRNNESYLSDDFDSFEEGILEVDSRSADFLELWDEVQLASDNRIRHS